MIKPSFLLVRVDVDVDDCELFPRDYASWLSARGAQQTVEWPDLFAMAVRAFDNGRYPVNLQFRVPQTGIATDEIPRV